MGVNEFMADRHGQSMRRMIVEKTVTFVLPRPIRTDDGKRVCAAASLNFIRPAASELPAEDRWSVFGLTFDMRTQLTQNILVAFGFALNVQLRWARRALQPERHSADRRYQH